MFIHTITKNFRENEPMKEKNLFKEIKAKIFCN